jgi:trehalose/maltose hydrolase-like predicted phosphorylase
MIYWILGLYVLPSLIGALCMLADNKRCGRYKYYEVPWAFTPGANVIVAIAVIFLYLTNYDNQRDNINNYLRSLDLNLGLLDQESQNELDLAKAEYERIIHEAKEKLATAKTKVKVKSKKRKLCNQLGLTLDDLDELKQLRNSRRSA